MSQISCECEDCKRSRTFKKHLSTIDNIDAKEFFENIFGYLYEIEEEIDCQNIYLKNLRTLYPRIHKEITTLEILVKDNAEYPEKQI